VRVLVAAVGIVTAAQLLTRHHTTWPSVRPHKKSSPGLFDVSYTLINFKGRTYTEKYVTYTEKYVTYTERRDVTKSQMTQWGVGGLRSPGPAVHEVQVCPLHLMCIRRIVV